MSSDLWHDSEVRAVEAAVRPVLGARLVDDHAIDDLCQETLLRVLRVRHRLAGEAVVPYAVTVAKNLVVAEARATDRQRRHLHRLDLRDPVEPPDGPLTRSSEVGAVSAAMAALPDADRRMLVEHVVEERETLDLAGESGTSAGGVAARLARARARARVEYLLAYRGSTLPTTACSGVLVALSAGDRRRQLRLDTAGHLACCPTCADLAPPLVERRRALVGLVPIPAVAAVVGRLQAWGSANPVSATAGGAAGAAVVAGALILATQGSPPPEPATALPPPPPAVTTVTSPLQAAGQPVEAAADLAEGIGRPVTASGVVVEHVAADEGFWVSAGREQVWVQLVVEGESFIRIDAGQRLSFVGAVAAHEPGFAALVGLAAEDGAAELDASGAHVTVAAEDITVDR